jgi:Heterokaryon incompatibility protein (HET)
VSFKLIDVTRRCVVRAPLNAAFVALSYIWGGVEQLKLDDVNGLKLTRPDGLLDPRVPQTIQDAIELCRELGESYLWVDSLCIMQNSSRDMRVQILRMRRIFSAAKLTVVAASGSDANAGLPNVQPVITSTADLDRFVDGLPWSQRGWCYQEKVLSRRLLLFTSQGIYVQCKDSALDSCGRALSPRQDTNDFNKVGSMLSIPLGQQLESYLSAVEYYCRRKLTKQSDRINAFQGILQTYGSTKDGVKISFAFGLPVSAFDQTFCWRTRYHQPRNRNTGYPSWSWLGWNTDISFDRKLINRAQTSQMIHSPGYCYPPMIPPDYPWKVLTESYFASDLQSWGLPTTGGRFYNTDSRDLNVCAVDLRIAATFDAEDSGNARYAVFPTKCSQQTLPPPPQSILLKEWLQQPLPELKRMDSETLAAASVPMKQRADDEHEGHEGCESYTPIGRIWLDIQWRTKEPVNLVMMFFPIAGVKFAQDENNGEDEECDEDEKVDNNSWRITMLMCVQMMEKNGHFWAHERVQIMDCDLAPEKWLELGAEVENITLV